MITLETQFVETVLKRRGEGRSKNFARNLELHWRIARRDFLSQVMKSLPDPALWCVNPDDFYAIAEKKVMHPSYFEKTLVVINMWGKFLSNRAGKVYVNVKAPAGFTRERMLEAVRAAGRPVSRASKPLTWPILCRAKGKLRDELHYNYLYILFFFGLRPSELDRAAVSREAWRVEEDGDLTILHIYQGKLKKLATEERWKQIPVEDPAQKRALNLFLTKQFRKPAFETVQKALPAGYGLYAPRKGFALHMVKRGFPLQAASRYLGHASIKTTESYYADRNKLQTVQIKADIRERRERRKKIVEVQREMRANLRNTVKK